MTYILIPALVVLKYVFFHLGMHVDAASISSISNELTIENNRNTSLEELLSIFFKSSEFNGTYNEIDKTKNQQIRKRHRHRKKQRHYKNKEEKTSKLWESNNSRKRHRGRKKTKKKLRASSNATDFEQSTKFPEKNSSILIGVLEMIKLAFNNNPRFNSLDTSILNSSKQKSYEKRCTELSKSYYTTVKKEGRIKSKKTRKRKKNKKNLNTAEDDHKLKRTKKKFNKQTTELFVLQNAHFQVFLNSSDQKQNDSTVPEKFVYLQDILDLENIVNKSLNNHKTHQRNNNEHLKTEFQDNLTNTLEKTIDQSLYRVHSQQNIPKNSKLEPIIENFYPIAIPQQSQNNTSDFLFPALAAIDSRLKFITVETNVMELVNNYTKTTNFLDLKVFSGPYTVSTSATPRPTIATSDKHYETESLENGNKIFLLKKNIVEPKIQELTYDPDIKHFKIIHDFLRNEENKSQKTKEESKEDYLKVDHEEMDKLFDIETRRLKKRFKKNLSGNAETKHGMFSELDNTTNDTSILNNNYYLRKRFSIDSGKKTYSKEKNSNRNETEAKMTYLYQPYVFKMREQNMFHYNEMKARIEEEIKQIPEWKRLLYAASYSDEENLIKKNVNRALNLIQKQDDKHNS